MTKQITIAAAPPVPAAAHNERQSPLRLRINAALAIGIAEFVLVTAIGAWIIAGFSDGPPKRSAIGWLALGALTIAVSHAAWLVITWSSTVAAREWRIDDIERGWRMDTEDEERAHKRALEAAGPAPAVPAPTWDFLPGLAFAILDRHFAGDAVSRDDCVKAGLCDQVQWNAANATFIAAGQKHGYTMTAGADLATAWTHWHKSISIRSGQVWCKKGKGDRLILGS